MNWNVKSSGEAEAKFRAFAVGTFLFFLGALDAARSGAAALQVLLIIVTAVSWTISYRFLSIRDKLDGEGR